MTGGYEHHWNAGVEDVAVRCVRPSVNYGSDCQHSHCWFGKTGGLGLVVHWQIGSRTVWTPVKNLDLSVEVMYNNLNTAYDTTANYGRQELGVGHVPRAA